MELSKRAFRMRFFRKNFPHGARKDQINFVFWSGWARLRHTRHPGIGSHLNGKSATVRWPLRQQNINPLNPERRLWLEAIPPDWENRWSLFDKYLPADT